MRFVRSIVALCAITLAAACAVKPLVIVDATPSDAALEAAPDATDALVLDALVTDALVTDAVVEDAVVEDASVPVGDGSTTPTSCTANPEREDCLVVPMRPGRSFCIGSNGNPPGAPNATPEICGLTLGPYAIDAVEIDVARFEMFHSEWQAGRLPAERTVRYPNGVTVRVPLPAITSRADFDPDGPGCNYVLASPPSVRSKHPINCVSRALAMYFCAWDGGRLPTMAEYEFTARWWNMSATAEGRLFPWGSAAAVCMRATLSGCSGSDGRLTTRVGSFPSGTARDLVFDLAGNVAEWVADDFATYDTLRTLPCWTASSNNPLCAPNFANPGQTRGGSYEGGVPPAFTVSRDSAPSLSPARGFRCARATAGMGP